MSGLADAFALSSLLAHAQVSSVTGSLEACLSCRVNVLENGLQLHADAGSVYNICICGDSMDLVSTCRLFEACDHDAASGCRRLPARACMHVEQTVNV